MNTYNTEDANAAEIFIWSLTYPLAEQMRDVLISNGIYVETEAIQVVLLIVFLLIVGVVIISIFGIIQTTQSKAYGEKKAKNCTSQTEGYITYIKEEKHVRHNDGEHIHYHVKKAVISYLGKYTVTLNEVLTREHKIGDNLIVCYNPDNPKDAIALEELKELNSKHIIFTPLKGVLPAFEVFVLAIGVVILLIILNIL